MGSFPEAVLFHGLGVIGYVSNKQIERSAGRRRQGNATKRAKQNCCNGQRLRLFAIRCKSIVGKQFFVSIMHEKDPSDTISSVNDFIEVELLRGTSMF